MQYPKRLLLCYTLPLTLGVNLVLALLSFIAPLKSAKAQIVPDGTLGAESSVVVPDNFNGIPIDQINGGAIRGANLFHSFSEFNVGEGNGAYFTNPEGIRNILGRVTGGNASNILGTLGVLGNANLFLINPNRIVFGPNARLDVGGSFLASTAESLVFDNGFEFSATNPQAPPLLTVNIPVGLRVRESSGSIANQSVSGLQMQPGNTLALVGGNVTLDGGSLQASGGRVELGGLAAAGTIGLNSQETQGIQRLTSLSFPDGVERANVSLTNQSVVNVAADGGGSIAIKGRDVNILGGSRLLGGIAPGLGSPETQAGNIEINATGTVVIDGVSNGFLSGAFNQVEAGSAGNSGRIEISAGSVEVKNGGQLNVGTLGRGNSGTIRINATDRVVFDGAPFGFQSSALSQVGQNAVGNSGGIEINARTVEVTDGGYLEANTLGKGNSGTIRVTATDKAVFDGESPFGFLSAVFSQVGENAEGNSGGIEINAGSVEVTNGGQLSANTLARGDAGKIEITARERVVFDGQSPYGYLSTAFSQVRENAEGNSGGIEINAGSVEVTNGGQLSANTLARGDAGKIEITARERVVFDGQSPLYGSLSSAFSQVRENAVGNSGGIEINAGTVEILNGAQLSATTLATGNAGKIRITATDKVVFNGESPSKSLSTLISQVFNEAVGNSGGIEINAGTVEVTNGAQLTANTLGTGNAGPVKITAREKVVFDGESSGGFLSSAFSQVRPRAVGDSGGIVIEAGNVEITNGALLDASTVGAGAAGAVQITGRDRVIFDGESKGGFGSSAISQVADGAQGGAGGIEINAGTLEVTTGAQLNTTTLGSGNSGSIQVTATNGVVFDGKSRNGDRSSAATSEVGSGAEGNSEGIEINSPSFRATNSAFVSANTNGNGDAGNINITANNIELFQAGQIRTNTSASSKAGTINLNAQNSITLSDLGTAVLAQTESTSTSASGNISIIGLPQTVTIRDGAELSINSRGTGTGGDISLKANSLTLDRGTISAETARETGGDITLDVSDLLLLPRDSRVTTNAGTESQPGAVGDGGNIKIKTLFLVALPSRLGGSDITANATYGNGGRVNLTATGGIFGIEFREGLTPFNDITASSTFGEVGAVVIIQPFDPSQNLVELPVNVVDPNDQIAQNPCTQGVGSEFTITGRGGLPPSPNEDLSREATQVGLVESAPIVGTQRQEQRASSGTSSIQNSTSQISTPVVPAQGWVFNDKGDIVLTAYNSTVTEPQRLPRNSGGCPAR